MLHFVQTLHKHRAACHIRFNPWVHEGYQSTLSSVYLPEFPNNFSLTPTIADLLFSTTIHITDSKLPICLNLFEIHFITLY